jgi:hypothetical protein
MPDTASSRPRTLVDKIWDDHLVAEEPGASSVLAIDLHLVHEVTSPQAFTGLRARGPTIRSPPTTAACRSSTRWPPPRWPSSRPTAGVDARAAESRSSAPSVKLPPIPVPRVGEDHGRLQQEWEDHLNSRSVDRGYRDDPRALARDSQLNPRISWAWWASTSLRRPPPPRHEHRLDCDGVKRLE